MVRWREKAYKKIPITQQVEVISLVGDIGLVNGKPVVHAHGVVGLEDGTTRGGHIISATVWPTLELFLTDEPRSLVKEEDPRYGAIPLPSGILSNFHKR